MTRVDDRYYGFVVTPELEAFTRKIGVPNGTCDHYGKEFLPLNADPMVPIKLHVGWPPTPEPFPVKITPEPHGAGSIDEKLHFRGGGDSGVKN